MQRLNDKAPEAHQHSNLWLTVKPGPWLSIISASLFPPTDPPKLTPVLLVCALEPFILHLSCAEYSLSLGFVFRSRGTRQRDAGRNSCTVSVERKAKTVWNNGAMCRSSTGSSFSTMSGNW
eukprot:3427213-Rhodomonas_salina.1